MITYFNLVGNVGQVIVREVKNGQATYLSIATSSYYNKKLNSQWVNGIVAYGPLGKLVAEKVMPGNKLYVSGTIKTYKKGKLDIVNFIVGEFRILQKTEQQITEALQRHEQESVPDNEDMYNSANLDPADLLY